MQVSHAQSTGATLPAVMTSQTLAGYTVAGFDEQEQSKVSSAALNMLRMHVRTYVSPCTAQSDFVPDSNCIWMPALHKQASQ